MSLNEYLIYRKSYPLISIKKYFSIKKEIKDINTLMIGRYCGSHVDQVLQGLSIMDVARRFPNTENYVHVEIGVLFGGSILLKLFALENVKRKDQLIVGIDPFSGYYDQNVDPTTGLKITVENLEKNLEIFGFEKKQIHILKSLSNDENAIKFVRKLKIISLMIDGDHSYEGIRNDWNSYSKLVVSGGICIIDDYQEKAWPDVTRFADEIIKNDKMWRKKVVFDTTLILERV